MAFLQVNAWLNSIYGEGRAPPFELNRETVGALYRLAQRCLSSSIRHEPMLTAVSMSDTVSDSKSQVPKSLISWSIEPNAKCWVRRPILRPTPHSPIVTAVIILFGYG